MVRFTRSYAVCLSMCVNNSLLWRKVHCFSWNCMFVLLALVHLLPLCMAAQTLPEFNEWRAFRRNAISSINSMRVEYESQFEAVAPIEEVKEKLRMPQVLRSKTVFSFDEEDRFKQIITLEYSKESTENPPAIKRPVVDSNAPRAVREQQRQMQEQYDRIQKSIEKADKINPEHKKSRERKAADAKSLGKPLISILQNGKNKSFRNDFATITPAKDDAHLGFQDVYLMNIGIPLGLKSPKPITVLPFGINLDTVIERVRAKTKTVQVIGGVEQIVFTGEFDVATAEDDIVFGIKIYMPTTQEIVPHIVDVFEPTTNALAWRMRYSDFNNVDAEVPLPLRCVNERFVDGEVFARVVQSVSKITLNQPAVPSDFKFPAGTVIADFTQEKSKAVR